MTPKAAEATAAALQARARGVRDGQQSEEASAVNRASLVNATKDKYADYDKSAHELCVPEDNVSATSSILRRYISGLVWGAKVGYKAGPKDLKTHPCLLRLSLLI